MKKPKNKKTKTFIKFNSDDRKDYLLGFRKRKLERKEVAKKEMVTKLQEEKKDVKKKRLELIKDMLDNHDSNSESEDDDEPCEPTSASTVSQCGNSTIEVTDLCVDTKTYLGVNKSTENKSLNKKSSMLQLVASGLSKRNLKSSLWKAASKDAEKVVKEKKKMRIRNRKRKVMVTSL